MLAVCYVFDLYVSRISLCNIFFCLSSGPSIHSTNDIMQFKGSYCLIFQIVISIFCSPIILLQYLLVSCKSKGPFQTVFSILFAPVCLIQYLLGLCTSKPQSKKLPAEKLKTILMTGASIQGKSFDSKEFQFS